ncbi:MAG: Ca-activated chloride channel [Actinomycetota bacterium]|jgi:Ca-activated chloride channel family protein|nr:Ca-activated chloride channel [Actinomycetota bacterium]MDQ1504365.1 Ca-activated chloride channel [Actinomycetota bacterium]
MLALDFASPDRLWLLAGAAALAVAYTVMQFRRRRDAAKFADPALLPFLVSGRAPWWRHAVAAVFAVGLVLATVAAAQPTVPGTAERQQATVIVAIDTSDSMKATDVSPSRLAAAVSEAKSFIEGLPSTFSVGIVSVDSNPKVVVAPSTDHQAVEVALDRLATSPGTALGEAIFTALNALPAGSTPTTTPGSGSAAANPAKAPAARIVLLSDGKSTTGRSDQEAIAAAKAAQVPVSTIAIGTAHASVQSAGQTVDVPVDATALQAIAKGTDGKFFQAASADQLRAVYADINSEVTVVATDKGVAEWFAAAALLLLLVASVTSMLRTGRVVWT